MNFFSKKTFMLLCIFCFIVAMLIAKKNTSSTEYTAATDNHNPNIETVIIQHGDSFSLTLNNTRLPPKDSSDIIRELKKVLNINRCLPGDFYEIFYDSRTGEWTDFLYYPTGTSYCLITKSSDGVIKTEKKKFSTTITEHKAQGIINSSLWAAMKSQNIPLEIITSFTDIFSWHIDFLRKAKKDDAFKIVYEVENISKKNKKLSSRIIAAQYKTPLKTYNAFYFKPKNARSGYFDENGKSIKSVFLKAPLQFKRISSNFTTKRIHPILKCVKSHLATDYAAPFGTPVSTVGDGIVKKVESTKQFGNLVVIKHPNNYETYYAHLSKYAKGIKEGVRVNQGEVIGYVGMTGFATGAHLDFRIKHNNNFFDFCKIEQPTITLTSEDKKEFKEKIQNLLDIFDDRLQNIECG